ncbi:MAG: transcriptional repressor LexA [Planctomycetota bacterium]|jgi:repressor LexA
MQLMLTEKQMRVLRFFRDDRNEHGISPTLEEAAQALGVSKITIYEHLNHLAAKGAIQRNKAKARSVAILYDPDQPQSINEDALPSLPILGTIAAGQPIEAIEDREDVSLTELIPSGDDYYMLRVQGHSMIEDHIDDGDLVVIHRQSTANNGDIVVAIVDGEEATLKRMYVDKGRIRLQPANSALKPTFPTQLEIRGVVRGVVRRFC